jgi:putative FmdB family regulatory protein
MPTYEYGCASCGSEWEEIQRITEPPVEVCPKCGKSTAQRLISAGTGFILKGGGWYSDLYSSAKPGANNADSKPGANNADSNATTSSNAPQQKDAAPSKTDAAPAKTESKASSTAPSTSSPASSS